MKISTLKNLDTFEELAGISLPIAGNDVVALNRLFLMIIEVMKTSNSFILEDLNVKALKKPSRKNLISLIFICCCSKNEKTSKSVKIHAKLSDTLLNLKNRLKVKINAQEDDLIISHHGCSINQMKNEYTLEMNNITDMSVFDVNYTPKKSSINYFLISNEYCVMNSQFVSKSIEFLHNSQINGDLGKILLNFLNILPLTHELVSLMDNPSVLVNSLFNALNCFEIEFYLRSISYFLFDDDDDDDYNPHVVALKECLSDNNTFEKLLIMFVTQNMGNSGYKLILNVLLISFPISINFYCRYLNDFFKKIIFLLKLNSSSKKLIDICVSIISKICENGGADIICEMLKIDILSIVSEMKTKAIGKVLSILPNRNSIFSVLNDHIEEFSQKVDQCSIFFDALINSIDKEKSDLTKLTDFAKSHIFCNNNYNTEIISSLSGFFEIQPSLFSMVDLNYIFSLSEKVNNYDIVVQLLLIIIKSDKSKLEELQSKLLSILCSVNISYYNIDPDSTSHDELRSQFSGLRNLGATCYINSSLQLLFNLPRFTNRLLLATEGFSNTVNDKNWKTELQSLFAVMKFASLPVADTTLFVNRFKMFGNAINVTEQQDTAEFLLSVIDGLPSSLNSLFSGTLISSFVGLSDNNVANTVSLNEERFICLSLSVDGELSLETSLDTFVQSDILEDYFDTKSNQKITVKRFTLIKELPPVLLVQLRRFVYDTTTLTKKKINSYFSFPQIIDMSRYCAGELSQEPVEYELTGFILHSGSEDSGHFHYVGRTSENEWHNFNDSNINKFLWSNIEVEAFGVSTDDKSTSTQNAYILCYQRTKISSSIIADQPLIGIDSISDALRADIAVEISRIRQLSFLMSNAFFNLSKHFTDVSLMYLYFWRVLFHLKKSDRLASVGAALETSARLDKQNAAILLSLLESEGATSLFIPLLHVFDISMIRIWANFTKVVIDSTNLGDAFVLCDTLMSYLNFFSKDREKLTFLIEIIERFLIVPENIVFAENNKWITLLNSLLLNVIKNEIRTKSINVADIIDLMKLILPSKNSEEAKILLKMVDIIDSEIVTRESVNSFRELVDLILKSD